MALFRISRTGAAPPTGLGAGGLSAAGTTFSVTSAAGYPTGAGGPFVLVIDPGTPLEEKVLCSSLSGTTVTVAASGRGWDGTTAAAHSPGAGNVAHIFSSAEADDANSHIYDTTRNDHTQYLTRIPSGTNYLVADVALGSSNTPLLSGFGTPGHQILALALVQLLNTTASAQLVTLSLWTGTSSAPINPVAGTTAQVAAGMWGTVSAQYVMAPTSGDPYIWITGQCNNAGVNAKYQDVLTTPNASTLLLVDLIS